MAVPVVTDAPDIPLTDIDSSLIEAIGYDAAAETGAVKFRSDGALYHYEPVTQDDFDELKNAPSVGRHFLRNWKDRFVTVRVQRDATAIGATDV